jgi:hypothetical protein
MKNTDRYNSGWEKLKGNDGEAEEKVNNGFEDISPNLGNFIFNILLEAFIQEKDLTKN